MIPQHAVDVLEVAKNTQMALVLQAGAWQIEEIGQVPGDDLNHFLGIGFVGATIRRGHEPYNVSGMPDRDRLPVRLKFRHVLA